MHLSGETISKFIIQGKTKKVGPNGVDVGVSEVWRVQEGSEILVHGKKRELSKPKQLIKPLNDFYELEPGFYELRSDVKISIPEGVVLYVKPRSTFNRLGCVKVESAVCDSGYTGFFTQSVLLPFKLRVHRDEAWFQLAGFECEKSGHSYNGFYQGERPEQ
ncbi:MAG: hypothetical protein GOU97_02490 [Nanoarchaeota archaeon]|nr:hypothetical protein [Nanoarchaeota archaeon]